MAKFVYDGAPTGPQKLVSAVPQPVVIKKQKVVINKLLRTEAVIVFVQIVLLRDKSVSIESLSHMGDDL